jgi:hypothetical protein
MQGLGRSNVQFNYHSWAVLLLSIKIVASAPQISSAKSGLPGFYTFHHNSVCMYASQQRSRVNASAPFSSENSLLLLRPSNKPMPT